MSFIFFTTRSEVSPKSTAVQNKRLKGLLLKCGQHGIRRLKGLGLNAVAAGDFLQQLEISLSLSRIAMRGAGRKSHLVDSVQRYVGLRIGWY